MRLFIAFEYHGEDVQLLLIINGKNTTTTPRQRGRPRTPARLLEGCRENRR